MRMNGFSFHIVTHEKSRYFNMARVHANELYSVMTMRGDPTDVQWENRYCSSGDRRTARREIMLFCLVSIVETVFDYVHKARRRKVITAHMTRAAFFSVYGSTRRILRLMRGVSAGEDLALVRQKNIRWSHMECLRKGVESNMDYILIVEDDFQITSPGRFWEALDEVIASGMEGCFSLSGSWEEWERLAPVSTNEEVKESFTMFHEYKEKGVDSCCATIYSRRVAHLLYESMKRRRRCLMAVDWEITRQLRSKQLDFARCYRAEKGRLGVESSMNI